MTFSQNPPDVLPYKRHSSFLHNAYDRVLDLGKIPLGPVEHITLVKGAGSVAYGPNGPGGAINITTRRPGEGPLMEGEFASSPRDDAYRLRVGSDVQLKSLGCHVDFGAVTEDAFRLSDRFTAARNQNGGERNNSDTKQFHISGKTSWHASEDHPGWPLENPPSVATPKSPTLGLGAAAARQNS